MTSAAHPVHGVRLRRVSRSAPGLLPVRERVGLDGVLDLLTRRARTGPVPGRATLDGFRWDEDDQRTTRWWPQGITTSADHDVAETFAGRRLVVTTAYARPEHGQHHGSRITVADVTDPDRVSYQHVLLLEAAERPDGPGLEPLRAHAGGIVWHGPLLYVACTGRGLACVHVDDVVRVSRGRYDAGGPEGPRGHELVLPVAFRYEAETAPGVEPLRYSFLSLDRGDPDRSGTAEGAPGIVVGEYGRPGMSQRLARYALDPVTSRLRESADGVAVPHLLHPGGVTQMQGAVVVGGRWYVTTSHGHRRGGSLWTGRPGELGRLPDALPPGPEDITYVPSADRLWTLTEHPGARWVCSVDRAALDRRAVSAHRLSWLPARGTVTAALRATLHRLPGTRRRGGRPAA
ncbi:MAG: hypothetical protein ACXVYW_16265 [Oryzihumus sp.]